MRIDDAAPVWSVKDLGSRVVYLLEREREGRLFRRSDDLEQDDLIMDIDHDSRHIDRVHRYKGTIGWDRSGKPCLQLKTVHRLRGTALDHLDSRKAKNTRPRTNKYSTNDIKGQEAAKW